MKKSILFLAALLYLSSTYAGGFRFPNFEYEYSKIYLFNLDFQTIQYVDHSIYRSGAFAKTKLGDGVQLTEKQNEQITEIFKKGADEIRYGLSKCFMPRHGIIYYDKLGNPVGSISACFECARVDFWSLNELPPIHDDFTASTEKKVLKQLNELQKLVEEINLPVFEDEKDYVVFRDSTNKYDMSGSIEAQDSSIDSLYFKAYTSAMVQDWVMDKSRHELREKIDKKYTAGGDLFEFKELRDNQGSIFNFSGNNDDSHLMGATIKSQFIQLPNGVSVGMSLEDVMNKVFMVYDGPAYPELIVQKGTNFKISYKFEFRTLVEISLESSEG